MATELPRRVSDILHTEHRVSRTRLRGLDVDDVDELRAIAGGARWPEFRIKALTVLAAVRDPLSSDVFRRALHDSSSGEVRAAGATLLSRLGGMAAEGELMSSLPIEPMPVVQHKIIAGLARVGSDASLRRLADASQALDPSMREHARFAQAVIAYRAGISGFELPVPDPALRLPAPPAAASLSRMLRARPEDAIRVIEETAGDSHGVVGDPESVAMIQCGRRKLAVVINAVLGRSVGEERLSRPALAGYVAVRAEVDGSFSAGLLVMSWPNGSGGLHVSVNRLSGRAEFFGSAGAEGEHVRFSLDAVRAPGATETSVRGILADGRVVELEVASGNTLDRMRPTPMEDY